MLGEQGLTLSGGQRQKIAIARALYRDPEILILDEATAALDGASQHMIQQALHAWKSTSKTIVMIAHRLSAIRNCDIIFVLKDGKLAEQGSHEALLQLGGEYHRLCNHENT
jgi:ATP-binding cassette subfamily B protein